MNPAMIDPEERVEPTPVPKGFRSMWNFDVRGRRNSSARAATGCFTCRSATRNWSLAELAAPVGVESVVILEM
jgi:hypothetical protein